MKNIVIIGSSGHGSAILDCIEKEAKYNVIGFIDSFKKKDTLFNGYKILGSEYDLPYLMDKYNLFGGIVAVGDNWNRQQLVRNITKVTSTFQFISTIHPSAIIGRNVRIGKGVAIMPGVIVNTNSMIDDHCILNTSSSLDHDGHMQEYSSLAPRVCAGGNLSLGAFSSIGLGSYVIENITIGAHTVIGAGTLVLRNIGNFAVAYGNPAKEIRKRKANEPYLSSQRPLIFPLVKSIASNF
ncbi:MAG: acetyltransferase [Maribacter sp.]|uniref:acetyltransferase n=1 Tax=Maribacter sp. TaxID=1897614 RepID=UPI003C751F8A